MSINRVEDPGARTYRGGWIPKNLKTAAVARLVRRRRDLAHRRVSVAINVERWLIRNLKTIDETSCVTDRRNTLLVYGAITTNIGQGGAGRYSGPYMELAWPDG
ncbi:MAG: hypothetical protein JW749_00700 [Sedimentisphaerales bacterium]|nr:hypothetical protein [Sedimentisphaerales bacterium]